MNIVLVEPEIPQNTGNIVRTAAACGAKLHLIEPLGFDISDKALKRAGLDYWHLVDIKCYKNLDEFFQKNSGAYWFLSTKAKKSYHSVKFEKDCYLFFGKETKGLDENLLLKNFDRVLKIPMIDDARSLNLSNSVAIVVYEALRQQGFCTLEQSSLYFQNKVQ